MTTGAGPRPWWNGVGFGLGVIGVTLFVVLFVPPAPTPPVETVPTTTAGRTITLDDLADELEAQLTDSPGAPPPSVVVETPDGPVTVVVPTTTTQPAPTTTTTTTTIVDRPNVPSRDGLLDDLLRLTPTTIPEGAGGGP